MRVNSCPPHNIALRLKPRQQLTFEAERLRRGKKQFKSEYLGPKVRRAISFKQWKTTTSRRTTLGVTFKAG
ncbi:hypothetical protein AMECASPLE_033534 [Ameca splendens]|uniref:Uncharacterized protein n=1 Tax=Ameca splendens TaxID=208324 RepID=A0ABV0XVV0_9TELE